MKRTTWIGWIGLLFALLPAWTVKSASLQNRLYWSGMLALFTLLGAVNWVAKKRKLQAVWTCGTYEKHNLPYVGAIAATSFLTAGFFAIEITYAKPGVGLAGELGQLLSRGSSVFLPVVAKYAAAIDPPLSAEALFRVQSIVSAFMLAGFLSVAAYLVYLVWMPKADRLQIYERGQIERSSPAFLCFAVPFAFYVAIGSYEGFLEFDHDESTWCLLQANCYARGDDLTIFQAALLKVLTCFGFPLGAILLIDSSRLPPSTS